MGVQEVIAPAIVTDALSIDFNLVRLTLENDFSLFDFNWDLFRGFFSLITFFIGLRNFFLRLAGALLFLAC